MATLEPILYADGALRLTDHGPQGGGVVLMNAKSGKQIDIPYKNPADGPLMTGMLDRELRAMDRCRAYEPEEIFSRFAGLYGSYGAR